MVCTYPSLTVQLPPEVVPERLVSVDQACDLLSIGTEAGESLYGASRHGWLAWAVRRLAEQYAVEDLDFLYCEPWQTSEECCAFLLQRREIDRVILAISFVLARAESHPTEFAGLLEGGYDAGDILECLHGAEASLSPVMDDGDAANYLFAYLKSFQSFCDNAREKGHAVLYAQWNGG